MTEQQLPQLLLSLNQLFFGSLVSIDQLRTILIDRSWNKEQLSQLLRYLYLAAVSRILSTVDESTQAEFTAQLDISQQSAKRWLDQNQSVTTAVSESLERSLLALE